MKDVLVIPSTMDVVRMAELEPWDLIMKIVRVVSIRHMVAVRIISHLHKAQTWKERVTIFM